jgi:hypothetical protein
MRVTQTAPVPIEVRFVGRECFSRKAAPTCHEFRSLGLLEDFCTAFRKRYVDGAVHDAVVPWVAHRKAWMTSFSNPALKPSSLPNNFWKSAVIIQNKRPCFGNQNASKVEGKKRKVEARSQKARFSSSKIVFQPFGLSRKNSLALTKYRIVRKEVYERCYPI